MEMRTCNRICGKVFTPVCWKKESFEKCILSKSCSCDFTLKCCPKEIQFIVVHSFVRLTCALLLLPAIFPMKEIAYANMDKTL